MELARYIIVVAGGRGTRMGSDTPKQFLPLAGSIVLMHTLERMAAAEPQAQLILALPHNQQEEWKRLCEKYHYTRQHRIVDGGATRFETVSNALQYVPNNAIVAIHDGVRPLVSIGVIRQAFATAIEKGSAIPVVPVVDSLRHIDGETSHAVERSAYRAVQTPQAFNSTLLKAAYDTPYRNEFTDDASVYEAAGHHINLIDGNSENIKITIPQDIILAEYLLSHC
ncbi:MAG: 2-C-methyl-D-erythritol 4-phosphate cytidylyltransferase [Bacteroidaceae bacterium]|nr:2-C-methyl-D-erythritol 4-phosphate cytidylyltransferase [Bacteroidaceae bacterium]